MTRVGLVAKPDAKEAQGVILRLLDWLGARGLTVVLEKETAGLVPAAAVTAAWQSGPASSRRRLRLPGTSRSFDDCSSRP